MIGHNGGPTLDDGVTWRRHCWTAAREALLPTLPIEVVRLRVKRARDLGLKYKTYASVRAATGHDLVAFLFSSNALRVTALRHAVPADRAAKLELIRSCGRIALATAPLVAADILAANPDLIDAGFAAPYGLARYADIRASLRAAIANLPSDRVLLVGDHGLERDWCAAGRLAGYLPAARYFASRN